MSYRDCSGAGSVALSVCHCFQPLVELCYLLPPLNFFSLLSTPFCALLANYPFLSFFSFFTFLPSLLTAHCPSFISPFFINLLYHFPHCPLHSVSFYSLILSDLSYFYQSYFSFMFSLYFMLSPHCHFLLGSLALYICSLSRPCLALYLYILLSLPLWSSPPLCISIFVFLCFSNGQIDTHTKMCFHAHIIHIFHM